MGRGLTVGSWSEPLSGARLNEVSTPQSNRKRKKASQRSPESQKIALNRVQKLLRPRQQGECPSFVSAQTTQQRAEDQCKGKDAAAGGHGSKKRSPKDQIAFDPNLLPNTAASRANSLSQCRSSAPQPPLGRTKKPDALSMRHYIGQKRPTVIETPRFPKESTANNSSGSKSNGGRINYSKLFGDSTPRSSTPPKQSRRHTPPSSKRKMWRMMDQPGASSCNAIDVSDDPDEGVDEEVSEPEEDEESNVFEQSPSQPKKKNEFGCWDVPLRAITFGSFVLDSCCMTLRFKFYVCELRVKLDDREWCLICWSSDESTNMIGEIKYFTATRESGEGDEESPYPSFLALDIKHSDPVDSAVRELAKLLKMSSPDSVRERDCNMLPLPPNSDEEPAGPTDRWLIFIPQVEQDIISRTSPSSSLTESLTRKLQDKGLSVSEVVDEGEAARLTEPYNDYRDYRKLTEERKESQRKETERRRRSLRLKRGSSGPSAASGGSIIFVYPMESASRDAITLHEADVWRTEPGEFLNDNLVDFYLKFLVRDGDLREMASKRRDFHIFSSHFFTKLRETDYRRGSDMHSSVQRWSRNVDLFSTRFVLVPIAEELHWSLAVLCNLSSLGKGSENDVARDPSLQPCILFMDSLRLHRAQRVGDYLRTYLEHEWKSRKGGCETEFDRVSLPLVQPRVPSQSNGCDCGAFLLKYAEHTLRLWPHIKRTDVNENLCHFFHARIFDPSDVASLRGKLKSLLEEYQVKYSAMQKGSSNKGKAGPSENG